jgi:tryptophan 2,3-dioxygenase
MLGETMADIAEEFTTWKYRHLMATRRTIGNRSGYFGTPAVSWLLPTLKEIPFPELFSARTFIGDQPLSSFHLRGQYHDQPREAQ